VSNLQYMELLLVSFFVGGWLYGIRGETSWEI